MIMKKQATYDLNAQRKLGIVDTEFNNNNKIIAKTISSNSKKLGTIAKEQYATKVVHPLTRSLQNDVILTIINPGKLDLH